VSCLGQDREKDSRFCSFLLEKTMRTLKEHAADCRAIYSVERGDWNTPWWICGDFEYRRSNGYAGGSRRGMIIECNSTNCNARIWISEDDVLAALKLTTDVF